MRKGRGCEIRIIFVSKEERWRSRESIVKHCSLAGVGFMRVELLWSPFFIYFISSRGILFVDICFNSYVYVKE